MMELRGSLAGAGVKLVLSGYRLGPLEATAAELGSLDTEIVCVRADVSQLADVQAVRSPRVWKLRRAL
jgi:NADP-dependent 3-hydroxy acid dehydrogenase YdfG